MDQPRPMTPEEFADVLNVSRETLERLRAYETLLRQWQGKINLVGNATLRDPWRRHFLDSGQLCRLLGEAHAVVDIGSGAGFPGLVIAIMSGLQVRLVESDQRKAAFLREAARLTGAPAHVTSGRAETTPAIPADAVCARAVAPLVDLLALAEPWCKPGGRCYFLKGAMVNQELTDAAQIWDIACEIVPSLSDPAGKILIIKEFRRV